MRSRTNHSRRAGLLVAGLSLAALAGGSAFTAGIDTTGSMAQHTGYKQATVSGGVINTLAYNLNSTGANVDTVSIMVDGDATASAVAVGFNDLATTSCTAGVYDVEATQTPFTCDNAGANFVQPTESLNKTAVVIN